MIINNQEHVEAELLRQYVVRVLQARSIQQAHMTRTITLDEDDKMLIRFELRPTIPPSNKVLVLNVKPEWIRQDGEEPPEAWKQQ